MMVTSGKDYLCWNYHIKSLRSNFDGKFTSGLFETNLFIYPDISLGSGSLNY